MRRLSLLLLLWPVVQCTSVFAQSPLAFEERVKAQEAIERVYYSHRIWPKDNPTPKPAFEKMASQGTVRKSVEDGLKKSALLDELWRRPITGEQLQAEMDRMVRHSKDPQGLKELFAALGNDPHLIAECLVRPILADRLIRNWYAYDERFHGELKKKVEGLQRTLTPETMSRCNEGEYHEVHYTAGIPSGPELPGKSSGQLVPMTTEEFSALVSGFSQSVGAITLEETPDTFMLRLTKKAPGHGTPYKEGDAFDGATLSFRKRGFDSWFAKTSTNAGAMHLPESGMSAFNIPEAFPIGTFKPDSWSIDDYILSRRAGHTAVWTGSEMIIWGGWADPDTANQVGGKYNPLTDTWVPTSTGVNCPSLRRGHTAVWTGTEMIVWGGGSNTGGRYNPADDSWVPTSGGAGLPIGCVGHTAVWTGSMMIVWGGGTNTGGQYNPEDDTWTATSTGTNVPDARQYHTAVWTGTEMIVWGGNGLNKEGGRYNPYDDTWMPTFFDGENVPSGRQGHVAVWTGEEMVVWGGGSNSGGRYNPLHDSWLTTSIDSNTPSARSGCTAVWTGSEMIVWGGRSGTYENTGGRYNPFTDVWVATPVGPGTPRARELPSAVWTGSELIVWGGRWGSVYATDYANTGGRYNPATDTWVGMAADANHPPALDPTSVWTGSEMIVWGGWSGTFENTGGCYSPSTDTWIRTSEGANVPSGRQGHAAVWTGSEMIVWGGLSSLGYESIGGRYDPTSDSWTATSVALNVPTGRRNLTAVWTGSEMIVWGGIGSSDIVVNTGGKYNTASDSWAPTITDETTPSARWRHTAVWTGSAMIVWGGFASNAWGDPGLNSGGRYHPGTNTWISTSTGPNMPSPRGWHTAVWTGQRMIVWGGGTRSYSPADGGGLYDPSDDSWSPTSTGANVPIGRTVHTAIWTGLEMIIWGGYGSAARTGAKYKPSEDSWTTITGGTPRALHTAVWTGSQMLIYGGMSLGCLTAYYPETDPKALPKLLIGDTESDTFLLGATTGDFTFTHQLPLSFFYTAEELLPYRGVDFNGEAPWHLVFGENCSGAGDFSSPAHAWRFGDSSTCTYEGGAGTFNLTSTAIPLIPDFRDPSTVSPALSFRYLLDTDAPAGVSLKGDSTKVEISADGGVAWVTVAQDVSHWVHLAPPAQDAVAMDDSCTSWRGMEIPLKDFIAVGPNTSIMVRFSFTRDGDHNYHLGWLIDDIGVGTPAGDGSDPCLTPPDSQGNNPQDGIPYHDLWDRATFEWDLNGDGVPDNPDENTPLWVIPQSDLHRWGLNVPGDHNLTLKVTDSLGLSDAETITLHVLDGVAPTATLITPNGGESWNYSPNASSPKIHQIIWSATDDFPPLGRIKLSYTTKPAPSEPDWTCIADSLTPGGDCAAGALTPEATSFLWTMPTQAEAAASVPPQAFPSSTARVRVEVWDRSGNRAVAASANPFYIIQPTSTSVQTLILTNTDRIGDSAAVRDKLLELAARDKVNGVVLDLKNVAGLSTLYADWDLDPTSVSKANAVADAIRTYVVSQVEGTYTGAKYLVLAGDDHVIPFYRVADYTATFPEHPNYDAQVDCTTAVGSAICQNHYLSDAVYGDLEYTETDVGSLFIALPDLSTGRLVESPQEIMDTVDAFISQDGQINLNEVLVTGYDFLDDCAAHVRNEYNAAGKTVDLLNGGSWTSTDLENQLFTPPIHAIQNLNDHSNHYSIGTPNGILSSLTIDGHAGSPLVGTIFYNLGCHSGLNAPDAWAALYNPADLPQVTLRKGALAYVGNTGFGWGLRNGVGYSERLMELVTEHLLTDANGVLGAALDAAKREYFLENHRYDVFDEKSLLESTLYGLPMYRVVVNPTAQAPQKPELHAEGPDEQEAEGVRLFKSQTGTEGALPPTLTELTMNFTFGESTYAKVNVPGLGDYYTLNGRCNGEIGDSLQPMFVFDSRLSDTVNHGVVFLGGHYLTETGFTPVVAVPQSSNLDVGAGPIAPGMGSLIGVISRTQAPQGQTFARAEASTSHLTRLTVYTGAYDGGTERHFDQMRFALYYSNETDTTEPTITDPGLDPAALHTLDGMTARFSVQASDASGIYRVIVAYTEPTTDPQGNWVTFDLAYNAGTGRWEGDLALKRDITYFAQAVDTAGNVSYLTLTGPDIDGHGQPTGSTYKTARLFSIHLADTDGDGMPNAWETLHGLNPAVNDAALDPDLDGLSNGGEFDASTDPQNADSDGDGDNDGSELNHGRSPLNPADGKRITITLTKVGDDIQIDWPAGSGDNGAIDGPYWVYRSADPFFGPGELLNPYPNQVPTGTQTYTDVGGGSGPIQFYVVTNAQYTGPAPTINVVYPTSGPVSGGTSVNIYGANFASGAGVSFGALSAPSVTVVNATTILCVTPAGAAPGTVDVTVTNPNGQFGTKAGGWTYE